MGIKKLLSMILFFQIGFANLGEMDFSQSQSAYTLAGKYLELYNLSAIDLKKEATPREAWNFIVNALSQKSGVDHSLITYNKLSYGYSFYHKNAAVIEFLSSLLKGEKKSWTQDKICTISPRIGDIGSGTALTMVHVVSQLGPYYEEKKWEFVHPLQINLYDILPEFQPRLHALCELINLTFPRYFNLTSATHDITQPWEKDKEPSFQIVLALNVLHYIPEVQWPNALKNISSVLNTGGMCLVTVDHPWVRRVSDKDTFQEYDKAEAQFKDPSRSPIDYNLLSIKYKGMAPCFQTKIGNIQNINILQPEVSYIPGDSPTVDQINLDNLRSVLVSHCKSARKNSPTIFLHAQDGTWNQVPIDTIIQKITSGDMVVVLSSYSLTPERLIAALSKEPSWKFHYLSWSDKLLMNQYGFPTSSGATFVKMK